jgi:hypothetical protein
VAGIAWDGRGLWVLDRARNRICRIEKSGATRWTPPPRPVGFIRNWLVCGPFPSPRLSEKALAAVIAVQKDRPSAKYLRGGHHVDYLGGEAAARPKEGQSVKRPDGSVVRWRSFESLTDIAWLHEVFGEEGRQAMVGYAYATIHRDKAGKALLAMGTDDNAKVFLNGKLVHDVYVARGVKLDEDVVPVTFRAGTNHLLIKIENVHYYGGFAVRPAVRLPNGELKGLPLAKGPAR